MRRNILIWLLAAALFLAGCGGAAGNVTEKADSGEESASRDFFAMDTYMSVLAYGENAGTAVEKAVQEVNRLDSLLSAGDPDSEVGMINGNGGGVLSEDGRVLMERSLSLAAETDGRFDVCIYPLVELWGFTGQHYRLPGSGEISAVLPLTDPAGMTFDRNTGEVSFSKEGMMIDFGGIAKGYTSSRIIDIFRENGIGSGLVSLGGNIQALGRKPDGSMWKIGIQDPEDSAAMIGVLEISDKAVITSGGYERFFEENGNVYHHILDPETGYPADSGLLSVTIVCTDGTEADGLSTSLFIMGKEEALRFWRERSETFDVILVTDQREIIVTEGLRDSFSSSLPFEIVQ